MNLPNPLLQLLQSNPRTLPVVWQWSIDSFWPLSNSDNPQISHLFEWLVNSVAKSSTVILGSVNPLVFANWPTRKSLFFAFAKEPWFQLPPFHLWLFTPDGRFGIATPRQRWSYRRPCSLPVLALGIGSVAWHPGRFSRIRSSECIGLSLGPCC